MNDLGLPYDVKTRQVQGRDTERLIAREKGARLHPMSGAGRIKDDASTATAQYEVKDANKSFTLNASDLEATFKRAVSQGKEGVWIVQFTNGIRAEIHLSRKGGL